MKYKYNPHASHPGYGWIEPLMDADCPLIEEGTAKDIVVQLQWDEDVMRVVLVNITGAKLCSINSMSSRAEMIRLMDRAIAALMERLA